MCVLFLFFCIFVCDFEHRTNMALSVRLAGGSVWSKIELFTLYGLTTIWGEEMRQLNYWLNVTGIQILKCVAMVKWIVKSRII